MVRRMLILDFYVVTSCKEHNASVSGLKVEAICSTKYYKCIGVTSDNFQVFKIYTGENFTKKQTSK
jgi:hypothetical protein